MGDYQEKLERKSKEKGEGEKEKEGFRTEIKREEKKDH